MTKIRKPRPYERNMLIVCEDTNTAPNYLLRLKENAIANGCWDAIEISPKPPLEEQVVQIPAHNPHKTPRQKRNLKNTDGTSRENREGGDWLDIELEENNREQPVRYVRTVQKALVDDFYPIQV